MTQRCLHIFRADLSRIEACAKSGLPRESCGILLGAQTENGWRVSGY